MKYLPRHIWARAGRSSSSSQREIPWSEEEEDQDQNTMTRQSVCPHFYSQISFGLSPLANNWPWWLYKYTSREWSICQKNPCVFVLMSDGFYPLERSVANPPPPSSNTATQLYPHFTTFRAQSTQSYCLFKQSMLKKTSSDEKMQSYNGIISLRLSNFAHNQ